MYSLQVKVTFAYLISMWSRGMTTLVSLRNPLLIPLYPRAGPISPNCIPAVQEQQLNHISLVQVPNINLHTLRHASMQWPPGTSRKRPLFLAHRWPLYTCTGFTVWIILYEVRYTNEGFKLHQDGYHLQELTTTQSPDLPCETR